jgi:hypothetical protein
MIHTGFLRRGALLGVLASLAAWVAPAASAAPGCHPGQHVLARRGGVVLWSARVRVAQKVRARVYACARSTGRTHVVAPGQPGLLNLKVGGVKVAGHFVAFVLNKGLQQNLVVFDLACGRRELTENGFMSQYALARNGFIAEVWPVPPPFSYSTMVATNDASHYYSIDFAKTFSSLAVSGGVLHWTSDLGGASSVPLGTALIPASSPMSLTPCQLVTVADASAALGAPASNSSSPGQCSYTKNFGNLTVGLQTGLSPAQVTSAEQALATAGWGSVGYKEGFKGLQLGRTLRGGVGELQLDAFENGAELSLDALNFSTLPAMPTDGFAWLTDVAFDRLFGVPVQRST